MEEMPETQVMGEVEQRVHDVINGIGEAVELRDIRAHHHTLTYQALIEEMQQDMMRNIGIPTHMIFDDITFMDYTTPTQEEAVPEGMSPSYHHILQRDRNSRRGRRRRNR